jgi:hypothetical protein
MNDFLNSALIEDLLHFNDRIDPLRPADLSEPDLLALLEILHGMDRNPGDPTDQACFWLTAARITELALLCAGNYADCAEFSLTGDLLANPLHIDIHFSEWRKPAPKWRHGRFSDQVGQALDLDPREVMRSAGAYPCIGRLALLPELRQQLEAGGMLSDDYLESVDRRMKSIADTLCFMAAWQIRDGEDLCLKLKAAGDSEKCFVESALCRFQTGIFDRLGTDLRRMATRRQTWSGFLSVDFFCSPLCQN